MTDEVVRAAPLSLGRRVDYVGCAEETVLRDADGHTPIPTISDVAERAGVSIRTVSRVLNRSPEVNARTRDTVADAIAQLGFAPSARARALASGRSHLIGVIQSDENAHVLGVYQRGIAEVCAAAGFELVVHHAAVRDDGLIDEVRAFVRRSRVDGLIILPPASDNQSLPAALASLGTPTVAIGARLVEGYSGMLVYHERAAAGLVARHLLDLGHRRMAMITGPLWRVSAQERAEGFVDALAEAGLALGKADTIEGDYGYDSGLVAARRLLDRKAARPTAIFACNDMMAAAVLKVAGEGGIAVPSDLSVVGFDDVDLATIVTPALTTVHRPLDRMTERATRQLLDTIEDRAQVGTTEFADFTLRIRDSTAPPPPNPQTPLIGRNRLMPTLATD